MIIKYVKLRNIRSYSSSIKIEFQEGRTLLLGDIGSGKSSILQAIEFALFGTGTSSESVKGSSLLRRGSKKGSVELCIEVSKKEIIIWRGLEKASTGIKQSNGYLIINGEKQAYTPVELKTRIIEILNYPRELASKSKSPVFRFTVYTPQEQMKQILNMGSDERVDTFRKIFQIEKYKRIKENSQALRSFLREKIEYSKGLSQDISEKKEELKTLLKKISERKESLKAIRESIVEKKENLKKIESEVELLKKKKEELSSIQQQLASAFSKASGLGSRASELRESIQANESEVEKSSQKLKEIKLPEVKEQELRQQYKRISGEIAEANASKATLHEKLQQVKNSLQEVESSKKDCEDAKSQLSKIEHFDIDASRRKLEEIKKIEKSLGEKLASIEKELFSCRSQVEKEEQLAEKVSRMDSCPLCKQPVGESHKQEICEKSAEAKKKLKEKMGQLEKDQSGFKQELEKASEQSALAAKQVEQALISSEKKEQLKNALYNYEKALSKEKDLKESLQKTQREIEKAESYPFEKKMQELEDIDASLRAFSEHSKLSALISEKQKQLGLAKKALEQARADIKELNKSNLSLKEKEDLLKKEIREKEPAEKDFVSQKEALSELNSKEKMILEIAKEDEEKAEKARVQISEKEKAKAEMERSRKILSWSSEVFIPMVENIEKHLFARVYNEFDALFREWFEMLVEDESIKVRLDPTFTPIIVQNGYDADVSDLSGGEKTSLALAYRLSLNQVINDVISGINTKDILILDEPTDGFSTEQMDRVRDVLDRLKIRQVIIVSHESKMESLVDYRIRVSKDSGGSIISA